MGQNEITCSPLDRLNLALTIYGEARGEGQAGKIAVGCVVLNRYHAKHGKCQDVTSVCLAPWQFSCWNKTDPNAEMLRRLRDCPPMMYPLGFPECLRIAQDLLLGRLTDITFGAKWYKVTSLPWPKDWGKHKQPCAVIGRHSFYNNIDD